MNRIAQPLQLGFDTLLLDADESNARRNFLKATSDLPGTWEDALPFYRNLIDLHHAAMLKADDDEVFRLRGGAHALACKLNGGTSLGICAPGGPGKRLEVETAVTNAVPKWGQAGSFVIDHDGMAVRIEMDGMFGIGQRDIFWPGFSAHAVDRRKPFVSETGYRSFLGAGYSELIPDLTPDGFVICMLRDFIDNQLGGKLLKVKPQKQPKSV